MDKYFNFSGKINAVGDIRLNNPTVSNLWKSFCVTLSEIEIAEGERNTFSIGSVQPPALPEGKEYALCVTEEGAAVRGCNYGGLVRGFLALLFNVECGKDVLRIRELNQVSEYKIRNRMIHICVFPENDLNYIKKLVRLCGLCQYTHIVIEFWGMLKFDCLDALAWPMAFTKEEAKEFIQDAKNMGMEPIPMFNMMGHATGSRLCYGKHVVLDQDPSLQHLFTPDGWAWNVHSEDVVNLHKAIREELYELFGKGEYFHVGLDEAYYYTHTPSERGFMPEYIKRLTDDVAAEGRRPMVWMDMMLERGKFKDCYATGDAEEVKKMIASLNPKSVMVDWQYDALTAPVESMVHLKTTGFDVMGAPWYKRPNYLAVCDTVIDNDLFGVMMTTWQSNRDKMPTILTCAIRCGAKTFYWSSPNGPFEETATMLRRVSFEGNTYEQTGWSQKQIEI